MLIRFLLCTYNFLECKINKSFLEGQKGDCYFFVVHTYKLHYNKNLSFYFKTHLHKFSIIFNPLAYISDNQRNAKHPELNTY